METMESDALSEGQAWLALKGRTMEESERAALEGLIAEVKTLRTALKLCGPLARSLENVRMLAMRLRRKDPENATHLLRFCSEAGIVGSILRSEPRS